MDCVFFAQYSLKEKAKGEIHGKEVRGSNANGEKKREQRSEFFLFLFFLRIGGMSIPLVFLELSLS